MFENGKSWGKFGFILTTVFDQTSKSRQLLTKTFFSQSEPHTAKLCFSVDLKDFRGNGANPEKKIDLFKLLFFDQTSKRGQILTKTVFLPKVSHIQLNQVFCCFEAFSGKLTENFSFESKKWQSQKGALKYSESLFFLTCLKRANS